MANIKKIKLPNDTKTYTIVDSTALHATPTAANKGKFLQSNGAGVDPIWAEVAAGGYVYSTKAPSNTNIIWIDSNGVARFYNGSAWTTVKAVWG